MALDKITKVVDNMGQWADKINTGFDATDDAQVSNVLKHGATTGGLTHTAGITASSSVLTIGGSPFAFTASDVGKKITIGGAGVAGGVLETTIASFTSGAQVTLATTASTTVTDATCFWGDDCTTAFDTAIAEALTLPSRTLVVPSGVFNVSDVSVPASLRIVGTGCGATRSVGAFVRSNYTYLVPSDNTLPVLSLDTGDYHDNEIRDFAIVGAGAGYSALGIKYQATPSAAAGSCATFTRIVVDGFTKGYFGDGATLVTFNQCTLIRCTDCVWIEGVAPTHAFNSCQFGGASADGSVSTMFHIKDSVGLVVHQADSGNSNRVLVATGGSMTFTCCNIEGINGSGLSAFESHDALVQLNNCRVNCWTGHEDTILWSEGSSVGGAFDSKVSIKDCELSAMDGTVRGNFKRLPDVSGDYNKAVKIARTNDDWSITKQIRPYYWYFKDEKLSRGTFSLCSLSEEFFGARTSSGDIGTHGWSILDHVGAGSINDTDIASGQFGLARLKTGGATNDSSALILKRSGGYHMCRSMNGQTWEMQFRFRTTPSNKIQVGLFSDEATPLDGYGIKHDATGNFKLISSIAGVDTEVDLGVAPDTAYHTVRMYYVPGASPGLYCSIDDGEEQQIAGTGSSAKISPSACITNLTGSAFDSVYLESFHLAIQRVT